MATAIKIPDLGTADETVTLVRWLKAVNETVKRGEALCEVETDKAASELESIAEGRLLKLVVDAGAKVGPGDVIAYVGQPGEAVPEEAARAADDGRQRTDEGGVPAAGLKIGPDISVGTPHRGVRGRLGEPSLPDSPPNASSEPWPSARASPADGSMADRVQVSMLIRNLAVREGVDLSSVSGTGPDGRITREDVLALKARQLQTGVSTLSANQRAVASQVARSARETVPIHLVCRIDMSAASRLRDELAGGGNTPPPYDVIFIHALSRCLPEYPSCMSHRQGEKVIAAAEVNISFAMALGKGLYRLVVTQTDRKSPAEIQKEVQQLMFRAARGQLTLADQGAACFSISNLGKYPVQSFTAVIPPGQSAVLAIGAVEEAVIMRGGHAVGLPMCSVTLTVDHLLINGGEAGAFLARLKEIMEGL